jgi:hypothetical protein
MMHFYCSQILQLIQILMIICLHSKINLITPCQAEAQQLSPVRQAGQLVFDIGLAAGNRQLSDGERLELLQKKRTAPEGFKWPFTLRMDRGKMRPKYHGPQHFNDKHSCFTVSLVKQCVFCKPCSLYSPVSAGGVKLDRLVKSPFNQFSH